MAIVTYWQTHLDTHTHTHTHTHTPTQSLESNLLVMHTQMFGTLKNSYLPERTVWQAD